MPSSVLINMSPEDGITKKLLLFKTKFVVIFNLFINSSNLMFSSAINDKFNDKLDES